MGCCWGNPKELEASNKWEAKAKRNCTDVFCLVIFVAYVAAMGCISGTVKGYSHSFVINLYLFQLTRFTPVELSGYSMAWTVTATFVDKITLGIRWAAVPITAWT